MKIYVAHTKQLDFVRLLYQPLRSSPLNTTHTIILPHETDSVEYSREIIKGCDVLIAEISYPSTSLGIEIGWADAFGVPVIAIRGPEQKKPWWTDRLCAAEFEYSNPQDLLTKLESALLALD